MKTFTISAQLLQGIVDYLGQQKFNEVHQLINAIQNEVVDQANKDVVQGPSAMVNTNETLEPSEPFVDTEEG